MREFLEEIARRAGEIHLRHFRSMSSKDIEFKGPRDLVSFVDRSTEDMLREAAAILEKLVADPEPESAAILRLAQVKSRLGRRDEADVRVTWPSGLSEEFDDVDADQLVTLIEGTGTPDVD